MKLLIVFRRLLILICIGLLVLYAITIFSCSIPNYATRKTLMPGETCAKLIKVTPIIRGGYKYLFISEKGDTLIQKSPVSKNYKIGKWYIVLM